MMGRRSFALLALLAMTGCGPAPADMRTACISSALDQPDLKNGVAVFTSADGGIGEARTGMLNFRDGNTVLDVASLTKPLVAAEVRRRIEHGMLALDEPASKLLRAFRFTPETATITVQQLLQHRAGFDRSGYDPLFASERPSCRGAAVDVLARPPELAIGGQTVYSNAGYCVLGETLLTQPSGIDPDLLMALKSPLGAAGGWRGSLRSLHSALTLSMPFADLEAEPALPDGSHYAFAWRSWPVSAEGPRWTHFGRLPGILSLALSDGRSTLLVAHFQGDPGDVDAASLAASGALWRCMSVEPPPVTSL